MIALPKLGRFQRRLRAVLLAVSTFIPLTALHGQSHDDGLIGLVPVNVEEMSLPTQSSTAVTEADESEPTPEPTIVADPIEQELRLQRAIAKSLMGQHGKAIETLGRLAQEDTAAMYAAGVWNLEQGELEKGVELLEQVANRPDAPAEVFKMLATGYLHLDLAGRAEAAAAAFLQEHQEDRYAHYVHGLAMLRQQEGERARLALHQAGYDDEEVDEIQLVMMQVPVDVAQRRSTISNTLGTAQQNFGRTRSEEKDYNLTLLFAGEYDSNVPLQPQFVGLGSNIDYEDYRFLFASFLDVNLLSTEEYNLGMVASTYTTFQLDETQFNIQDYMGGAYANAVLTDDLIGSFRYEYHHTLVDQDRFAIDHRLTPSLTWLGSRGHTTAFYEYNPIDADAPARIPAQFQSADIHRLGLTQAAYTYGGDGRVYVGYQYANAIADGSDFDRESHMVTTRIECPLPRNWIADFDVRYVWDDYDNPNSLDFFDRVRNDDRLELRTGLQKNFAKPVSLRFDYTYFNNDSNTENLFGVRFYDYDRHIFSTQLIFSL